MKTNYQTIDEYIAGQPEAFQPMLEEMRGLIKSVVPEAEELISYQIPSFKYKYMLVGFGATKKQCSFYLMSSHLAKEMKEELAEYSSSGTTLHFAPDQRLPKALIKKVIKARVKENLAKAKEKKK